jgi:hypothetical protein
MLDKGVDDDAYSFKMDLWRRWVARMHSIWQVVDEIKSNDEELGEGVTVARKRRSRVVFGIGAAAAVLAVASIVYTNWIAPNRGGVASGVSERAVMDSTTVTILTEPPGAWIFLDRERIGRSPVENLAVPAGEALLGVELGGYEQFVDTLSLRKDEPFERSITLEEKTGHLKLTSTPEGADIQLNGQNTGLKTPATIENLSINRRYSVRLSLPQYNSVTQAGVELEEDSVLVVHRALATSTSQVQFVTTPRGATVSVDGRPLGETPDVFALTYGSHQLVLEKNGYQVWERTITIPVSGNRVAVELDKLPLGTVILKVSPYADVYIDGEKKGTGTTRVKDTLDPGTYTIEFRHPHFGTVTRVVEVASNDTTEVTIDMEKEGKTQ